MNDEKGAMVIVVYLWFGLAVVCFVTTQVAEPPGSRKRNYLAARILFNKGTPCF